MSFWYCLALNAVQVGIVLLVLGFTQSRSLFRPALLPFIVALSIYTVNLNRDSFTSKTQSSFVTINTIGTLLQYIDFGLISRWTFSARGPTSLIGGQYSPARVSGTHTHKSNSSTFWERVWWGLCATTTWRAPGTPWQVKNIPPFDSRQPAKTPSRSRFVLHNLFTLAVCLLVIDLSSLGGDESQNQVQFSWQKVGFLARLGEVTAEDLTVRASVTFLCWTLMYCIIQATYSSMALVAVASGVTPVESWPPMFGSLKESYSIRGFWGNFWHQTIRQKIASPAYFATYSIFRLRKGSLIARYTYIFLAFAVSGLLHLAEEYSAGIPPQQGGSMRFYCAQALGILLEDTVKGAYKYLTGGKGNGWTRAIGYVWVSIWLVWSSPAWFYPKLYNNTGSTRDRVLPVSLLGSLL